MEFYTPPIYSFSVLLFIFLALFIFVGFRLFKFFLRFLRLSRQKVVLINRYLPVTELTVWSLFFIWAIQFLYNKGYLLVFLPAVVFFIIIIYLSWFALKDMIAGVIFKTANQLQINDHITIADTGISGKVLAISRTSLEVEEDTGRLVTIPYSRITGNIIFKNSPSQSLLSHSFSMKIATDKLETDVFDMVGKIKTFVLALPWSSQKKQPKISIDEESDEFIILSLTIYSLDQNYFTQTEKLLTQEFGLKILPGLS